MKVKTRQYVPTWEYPAIVQSINSGCLKVAYGFDKNSGQLYGGYRSSYDLDLIGLASNFTLLTKEQDLAGHFPIILKNLLKEPNENH